MVVGANTQLNTVLISQATVQKVYPARTGMEDFRYMDFGNGRAIDRRNQTYQVSDTQQQPLSQLQNADWNFLGKLVERLEQTNPETEGRVWSNAYTWDYLEKFPLTGSGGGSYYGVFPNFQPADLPGYYNHAHNDYLEFAVELGLPAACLLLAVVVFSAWHALKALSQRRTPLLRGAAFAVLMTVAWGAIHSATDFNLQIPANSLTFVTILALAVVVRALPGGKANPNGPGSE